MEPTFKGSKWGKVGRNQIRVGRDDTKLEWELVRKEGMIPNLSEVSEGGRDNTNIEWKWVREGGMVPTFS